MQHLKKDIRLNVYQMFTHNFDTFTLNGIQSQKWEKYKIVDGTSFYQTGIAQIAKSLCFGLQFLTKKCCVSFFWDYLTALLRMVQNGKGFGACYVNTKQINKRKMMDMI